MFRLRVATKVLLSLLVAFIVTTPGWANEEEAIMIEEGRTVSIAYTLKLDDGTTVDSNIGADPLSYTQGGGQILPALEEALAGHKAGDTKEVQLTAEQGYGPVNPGAFQEVEIDMVPEDARSAGTMLMATGPDGQQQPIKVHEVKESTVVLDFNHPLAGQALNFDIEVLSVE